LTAPGRRAFYPKVEADAWRDRPFSEKMELIAAIEEVRAWRFGSDRPSWLRPAAQSAAELGEWLDRYPQAQKSLRLE
jgi:hypothetical protein